MQQKDFFKSRHCEDCEARPPQAGRPKQDEAISKTGLLRPDFVGARNDEELSTLPPSQLLCGAWVWLRRTGRVSLAMTCCLLLFAVSGCGSSFHFKSLRPSIGAARQPEVVITPKRELRVGERLTYEIKWMGIPVGIASFGVKEIANIRGRDCYHIRAGVRSNAFLSKIYRVDDEFHTYIDKERLHSLRFMKRQSEGRYRSHEIVDYDQETHKAVYRSLLNNSKKDFTIAENSQDNLSAIYCFRMRDVKAGESVLMNVNADEKNWILHIDVLRRGVMRLPRIGNLNAIEVEPHARTMEGKPLEKGKAWIWFGSDENRIPLAAKAKAAIVGTVTAVLTEVE